MMFPLVRELAVDGIPVAVTCRVLKLGRQPYYRWLDTPITDGQLDEAWPANAIFDAHRDDPEFGYRFLADEVRLADHVVSDRVVAHPCRPVQLVTGVWLDVWFDTRAPLHLDRRGGGGDSGREPVERASLTQQQGERHAAVLPTWAVRHQNMPTVPARPPMSVARSRPLLKWSQLVSGTRRQWWHAPGLVIRRAPSMGSQAHGIGAAPATVFDSSFDQFLESSRIGEFDESSRVFRGCHPRPYR